MTDESGDGSEDGPAPVCIGATSDHRHDERHTARRVMTDGGGQDSAEDSGGADDGEGRESDGTDENDGASAETEESSEPDEQNGDENEPDESEAAESDDGDGEPEDDYHVEDADDVYEGDDASGVLHLDLDGLFLDLLGLEVNLNPVTLDVSARPGENNLLGNLLSAVTGLLDGPKAMMSGLLDKAKSLLEKPKELLSAALEKPKQYISGLYESVVGRLKNVLGLPFGRDDTGDEQGDEEQEADDETSGGWLSSAGQWLKEKLLGLVPNLPIEELVAAIVSEIIRQLAEQTEPRNGQDDSSEQTQSDTMANAEGQS